MARKARPKRLRLTKNNYYTPEANRDYMSCSQFKAFDRCEAAALAELQGENEREPSAAMLIGSYVDAFFSREMDIFTAAHPEIFKRDGTLKSEFDHADLIIERMRAQPEMMRLLKGQKQRIFTGTIGGVPFKCKTDCFSRGRFIADMKVMKDFAPIYIEGEGRVPWFEAWGYDTQAAIYQELVRQKTGEKLPFYLVAATKEPEPDLAIIEISQTAMDYELKRVEELAPRYDAIKSGVIEPNRCDSCAYCRRTKKVEIINSEVFYNA